MEIRERRQGWIGVDLDGTLAYYDPDWFHPVKIGEPIPEMLARVKTWLAEGRDVRIFTARVCHDGAPANVSMAIDARLAIERWCEKHLGQKLPITNVKDYDMVELWDDRAVQVETNSGRRADGRP